MKILMLAPHYITPKDFGGVRSWQIGSYLVNKGHTVIAIVPGVNPRTDEWYPIVRGHLYSESKINGVRVLRTTSFRPDRKVLIRRILYYSSQALVSFIIGLFSRNVDVILATSAATTMFFAWLLATIKRTALIIDARDLMTDIAIETGYLKPSFWVRMVLNLEKFVLKRADKVITISPGLRDMLIKKGLREEDVVVIPIGFEQRYSRQLIGIWMYARCMD